MLCKFASWGGQNVIFFLSLSSHPVIFLQKRTSLCFEMWACIHIDATVLCWENVIVVYLPIQAEYCVAIMHQVHIHFLHIFMFHHIEGEEIHPWNDYQSIFFIEGSSHSTDYFLLRKKKKSSWDQNYFSFFSGHFALLAAKPKPGSFLFYMCWGLSHVLFQKNDFTWTQMDCPSLPSDWKWNFPKAECSDFSFPFFSLFSCSCLLLKGLSLGGHQVASTPPGPLRAWAIVTALTAALLVVMHPVQCTTFSACTAGPSLSSFWAISFLKGTNNITRAALLHITSFTKCLQEGGLPSFAWTVVW